MTENTQPSKPRRIVGCVRATLAFPFFALAYGAAQISALVAGTELVGDKPKPARDKDEESTRMLPFELTAWEAYSLSTELARHRMRRDAAMAMGAPICECPSCLTMVRSCEAVEERIDATFPSPRFFPKGREQLAREREAGLRERAEQAQQRAQENQDQPPDNKPQAGPAQG